MLSKYCYFLGVVFTLLLASCDTNQIYDEYQSVDKRWHKDSIKTFKIEVPDTIKPYNLFVNIRNTNDYKYNNLFLVLAINHPNGKVIKDTLEYKMAAPNGELLGSGFSDLKENKLWYKGYNSPFIFDEPGVYAIEIQHTMRAIGNVEGDEYLEGITDVGFRIESTQN